MGKSCRNTARTSNSRRPDKNAKELQVLYEDPIIIPHDEEVSEEPREPLIDNWGEVLAITGKLTLGLFLLRWGIAALFGGHPLEWDFFKEMFHLPPGK